MCYLWPGPEYRVLTLTRGVFGDVWQMEHHAQSDMMMHKIIVVWWETHAVRDSSAEK